MTISTLNQAGIEYITGAGVRDYIEENFSQLADLVMAYNPTTQGEVYDAASAVLADKYEQTNELRCIDEYAIMTEGSEQSGMLIGQLRHFARIYLYQRMMETYYEQAS